MLIYLSIFVIALLAYLFLRSLRHMNQLRSALADAQRVLKERLEISGTGQAKFDAVISSMFEGVLVTDERGAVLLMNPSLRKTFLIDFAPEGKRVLEVIRNAAIQEMVELALRGQEKLISTEMTLTVPEERFLKVNAVPIVRNDAIEGAILVFHDISELRRLERVRQDFVANVSHELRTPIASVKGYAETLLDGAMEDKAHLKNFIEIIYKDSERLAKLIDDLLDLAKIESGKMKVVLLPVDLAGVIHKTVSVLENQAKSKAISIKIDLPRHLPRILADETQLAQVFLNLLDNALKYTPEKGAVAVSASQKDQSIQVDVRDTGMGIPEKDLPRVFERFYRVDKARSKELGGTGLGLSIVKHIVQAHGGDVWVESQLGQGSTFSFIIPTAS